MGEIVWLCRYPVKSMRGETLRRADIDQTGVRGDRRRAVLDRETGLIASVKNPAKWSGMLDMSAAWAGDEVRMTLPNGSVVGDREPGVDDALSEALERPVTLIRDQPEVACLERVTPEGEPAAGDVTLSRIAGAGSFVDFGAVHIVTTATLDRLGPADARRFRPNVVVRMVDDVPFAENAWPGRRIAIGSKAMLRGVVPTPRCVVPTLAHGPHVPADRAIIGNAARQNRVPVFDLGKLTCVGAYAAVEARGRIAVGDLVRVV
jgi:uncharacterized protein